MVAILCFLVIFLCVCCAPCLLLRPFVCYCLGGIVDWICPLECSAVVVLVELVAVGFSRSPCSADVGLLPFSALFGLMWLFLWRQCPDFMVTFCFVFAACVSFVFVVLSASVGLL